jgi:hypothetical protein
MTDFKLESTRDIERSYQSVPSSISNDKIREVAQFFVQNMDRVCALGAFPLGVFNLRWVQARESKEIQTSSGTLAASRGGTTGASLAPSDSQRFSEVIDVFINRGFVKSREQVEGVPFVVEM